jgi:hypothetical protein
VGNGFQECPQELIELPVAPTLFSHPIAVSPIEPGLFSARGGHARVSEFKCVWIPSPPSIAVTIDLRSLRLSKPRPPSMDFED